MKKTDYSKLVEEIECLEEEISKYPIGTISVKKINGIERYYHQWYEAGKTKSKYLKKEEAEMLSSDIELRRKEQKKLKELKEKLSAMEKKKDSFLNKKFDASITLPIEIVGWFNGRHITPDKNISLEDGQQVLVTIRKGEKKSRNIDLNKYVNHGEKLFKTDAQEYVRRIRDEERF